MKVFFSNRLEALAERMKALFLEEQNPFNTFHVVIPSVAIKNWLAYRFAQDADLHIFSGIRLHLLGEYVKQVFPEMPSCLELSLTIEQELHRGVEGLEEYLAGKSDRQMGAFCDELSLLFLHYATFGQDELVEWGKKEGWQQRLWGRVWKGNAPWKKVKKDLAVFLFGFSFLPPHYLESIECSCLFSLSPSALYWEDFLSDRKQAFLRFKQMAAVKIAWQEYFNDQNPLLANLGMLGQRFLKQVGLPDEELYEEPEEKCLLSCLQKQMLLLEKEEVEADESIQIHAASSRWREVEVVANTIQRFNLKKVAVYAPDIAVYAPYIHLVFSALEIDYAIHGLPFSTQSSLFPLFQLLLQLPQREFQATDILKLLSFDRFIKKWGFSEEDVEKIKEWVKEAHIVFAAEGHGLSWKQGFWRLLEALVLEKSSSFLSVGISEAELLGNWVYSVTCLIEALNFEGKKPLEKWALQFKNIFSSFFILQKEDESFLNKLSYLEDIETEPLPFASFERVLKSFFSEANYTFQPHLLHAIQFRSLSVGVSTPEEAVIVMGLEEGAFPRPNLQKNLKQMALKDLPSSVEEDRMLFLELFLNARKHFILTYSYLDEEDKKEKGPSLLIEELLRIGPIHTVRHPSYAFDKAYFQGKDLCGSVHDFSLAQAFYAKEKKTLPPLLSLPSQLYLPEKKKEKIEIWQMKKTMGSPLQLYFEKKHRLFFEKEEQENREFSLTYLDLSWFRKTSLSSSLEEVISQARQEGRLPVGVWEPAAIYRIQLEVESYKKNLNALAIAPEEIFSVQLVKGCDKPEQIDQKNWVVPAIEVDGIQIVGTLENVTSKGVIVHGKAELETLLKMWPLYLLSQLIPISIKPQLLCTKEGKIFSPVQANALGAFEKFVKYLRLCEEYPSPFFPQMRSCFLEENVETFEKKMGAVEQQNFTDPALLWMKKQGRLPPLPQWYGLWKETIKELFDVFF